MAGNEEAFEEWGAEILDQLIKVEELALSSSSYTSVSVTNTSPYPYPYPYPNPNTSEPQTLLPTTYFPQQGQIQPRQEPPFLGASSGYNPISYSPPRELSQRTNVFDSFSRSSNGISKCDSSSLTVVPNVRCSGPDEESDIERLKRELGRVSKQLSDLEQECFELRKERVKKEEQNIVTLNNKERDVIHHHSRSIDLKSGTLTADKPGVYQQYQNGTSSGNQIECEFNNETCKEIGVQTDVAGTSAQVSLNSDLPAFCDLSKLLQGIWSCDNDQILGKNLASKLLVVCETDFHLLFDCMSTRLCSKSGVDTLPDESSVSFASQCYLRSFHASEAVKVSDMYSVLMKVNNGMVHLEALIEQLLDLCRLENAFIIHSSLHILHVLLKHMLRFKVKSTGRNNVMVDGLCSANSVLNPYDESETGIGGGSFFSSLDKASSADHIPWQNRCSDFGKRKFSPEIAHSISYVDWVSLFQLMLQVAMKNVEEYVRVEAMCIMNVILMGSNAYLDRERFGYTQVFESLPQLLKKEAGLLVRKHSMQLLYLLLNCPKVLATFCSGCSGGAGSGSVDDAPACQKFTVIFQGLADCLACHGNSLEELKLRRNTIVLLAFLASSGQTGFEILATQKLYKDSTFLMLIMQVLVSEIETEAACVGTSLEIFNERTLLIREALILLNRLVSNPTYSATSLQLLTGNRDMVSLTVDIANRLSQKDHRTRHFDYMERRIRESEVDDLARIFKRRVFNYLGDHVS